MTDPRLDVIDEHSDEMRHSSFVPPGRKSVEPGERRPLLQDLPYKSRPLFETDGKEYSTSPVYDLEIRKQVPALSVTSAGAMTNKELEIVRAEMAKDEFEMSKKEKIMSWLVLMTLLLAQISNQWQRFLIATAYQYKLPDDKEDPYYMMSVAIPNFSKSRYGLLSGALFTSLFSITVLFSGVLSDNCSRRLLLSFAAVLWSITSLTTAISDTFSEIALSRMMLGFFEAFCGPPAYSLIVDYFPPEVRTTANAVYAFGIYVGNALSSMIIVMIDAFGWRWTYAVTGFIGIAIGILVLLIVKDPIRGRFEPRVDIAKVEDAIFEDADAFEHNEERQPAQPNLCVRYLGGFMAMFTNNVCFYVVLGASFRYWQGYTIAYYALSFFGDYN
mmetsp:Transcript_12361/g.15770  ORF Transcript_12361/g.15770 Transcript_12361/m.15770 type:complete len:386 (+) Transcript_12361:71-1228(+)